jgi:hypothetical protein
MGGCLGPFNLKGYMNFSMFPQHSSFKKEYKDVIQCSYGVEYNIITQVVHLAQFLCGREFEPPRWVFQYFTILALYIISYLANNQGIWKVGTVLETFTQIIS